ncbi:hypothetical protein HELRODRAFT_160227 [Helobdella robusta]|uniref:protein-tyrosine-phosphatase n=1 Tax=Helobdella robusta TaxID=6412 RepID=T1EQ00_HELRO|nr:hypothetical protein HELRODRAFT_160227 [Helobdella robusta]ESO06093.1 hypothetical protein HELRODRAFT_160227 [Helobdella robusta]
MLTNCEHGNLATGTQQVASTGATSLNSTAIGIGVGLGGACLLIAAIIFIVLLLTKKSRKPVHPVFGGYENEAIQERTVDFPEPAPNPIKVANLLQFLRDRKSNKSLFFDEFKSLPPVNPPRIKSCSEAVENASKNRFMDILPYNEDRVKLIGSSCDYINASYIDSYSRKNAFIATQGPLPQTCHDFWLMVWEQNSSIIIMVANLFEDGAPKCAPYFPFLNKLGEPSGDLTFDDITILLTSQEKCNDYIVRQFSVQKDGESKSVKQYHYTEWPDKGVPNSCSSILKFYEASIKNNSSMEEPIITHCSAGVGRTGTLLAIGILLEQAAEEGCIDVRFHVDRMRRRRMAMVQVVRPIIKHTKLVVVFEFWTDNIRTVSLTTAQNDQYLFTYAAVIEKLLVGDVSSTKKDFKERFLTLETPNHAGDCSLKLQHELLEALKPMYLPRNFTHGTNPANRNKNRFSKILPVDDFKPFIKVDNLRENDFDENYINAIFVQGFKKQDKFIVTHMPMKSTENMFWALVKQYNCCAIVMLNECLPDEQNYWPSDGQALSFGPLTILNTGEISSEDVFVSSLKVSEVSINKSSSLKSSSSSSNSCEVSPANYLSFSNQCIEMEPLNDTRISSKRISSDPSAIDVRHIRVNNWKEGISAGEKKMALLTLVSEVSKCLQRSANPSVLIHCLNGAERSGLFCALLNTIDKYEATKEIDIFNSVKLIQKSRPEFVSSMEQLKTLYEIVDEYISTSQS